MNFLIIVFSPTSHTIIYDHLGNVIIVDSNDSAVTSNLHDEILMDPYYFPACS
jgi:hypothetical protein